MTVTKEMKAKRVRKFGENETDTGKTEVQIAIITDKIINLTAHSKKHPKDNNCKRGLLMLVGKRRRLLNYLTKIDIERYRQVIIDLKLRK